MKGTDITINVYGTNWCNDCRRTKKYLGEQRIHYNWYDIEKETSEGKQNYRNRSLGNWSMTAIG